MKPSFYPIPYAVTASAIFLFTFFWFWKEAQSSK